MTRVFSLTYGNYMLGNIALCDNAAVLGTLQYVARIDTEHGQISLWAFSRSTAVLRDRR